MSTALFLAENKGIEDARSDEVLGIKTSTDSLQIEEEWMDHGGWEYQSGDDMCAYSPLRAGALPLELWWSILEIIDDPRALLACGCTCVAFRDAVRRVIFGRAYQWSDHGTAKIKLAADPTSGYFFHTLRFWSHDFLSWMSTLPIPSPRLRTLDISGPQTLQKTTHTLSLRFQTRLALSRLTTITRLHLSHVHFLSFSEFARFVCTLPNLATLYLRDVTANDMGSSDLPNAYFTHNLRLKWLIIEDCAFGESHPIWSLLTAPSLSDSLKSIDIESKASDPQRSLQELSVPPAAVYSANLAQLTTLRLSCVHLACEDVRSTLCRDALSRSSPGHFSDVEINCHCYHSPPHLSEWGSLFSVLDDTVMAGEFSSLRTISVSFWAQYPFDVDDVRTLVGSRSHSSKWTATFAMSSMMFRPDNVDETHTVSEGGPDKTEVATEECTERISQTLCIVLGRTHGPFKVTVRYTRDRSP